MSAYVYSVQTRPVLLLDTDTRVAVVGFQLMIIVLVLVVREEIDLGRPVLIGRSRLDREFNTGKHPITERACPLVQRRTSRSSSRRLVEEEAEGVGIKG